MNKSIIAIILTVVIVISGIIIVFYKIKKDDIVKSEESISTTISSVESMRPLSTSSNDEVLKMQEQISSLNNELSSLKATSADQHDTTNPGTTLITSKNISQTSTTHTTTSVKKTSNTTIEKEKEISFILPNTMKEGNLETKTTYLGNTFLVKQETVLLDGSEYKIKLPYSDIKYDIIIGFYIDNKLYYSLTVSQESGKIIIKDPQYHT